jgi:hypothetical protein
MGKRGGFVALLLVLLLVLAPATPRADGGTAAPEGVGTAMRYVACAGSIVFMVAVPASIFYTALVCINAFLIPDD